MSHYTVSHDTQVSMTLCVKQTSRSLQEPEKTEKKSWKQNRICIQIDGPSIHRKGDSLGLQQAFKQSSRGLQAKGLPKVIKTWVYTIRAHWREAEIDIVDLRRLLDLYLRGYTICVYSGLGLSASKSRLLILIECKYAKVYLRIYVGKSEVCL